jgi:YVTN family beta-propeller protein
MVDPATRKILGTVRVGEQPHEVEASNDGKLAFVSNYGTGPAPGNTISVIDIAARKELHRVDLGPLRRPHGIAVAENKAYFTAEANKIIGRYDPATNQVDWLLGTGQNSTHMVWVNPDASLMFTANIGSDSITMIERDGSVSVIDIATKRVVHTFNVQTKRSNRLKFTPDARLVLISDLEAGDLVVLERATRKELKKIKLGRQPAGILVTPDSAKAYVAVTGDDNVAVIDLKTLDLADRLKTGSGPDGMAWVK